MNKSKLSLTTTLTELINLVPDTSKSPVPTARSLSESQQTILFVLCQGNSKLTVYENGYFTYRIGNRVTVQSVHNCTQNVDYVYDNGDRSVLGMEFFANEPFIIRLTLEGERRLEQNQYVRDGSKLLSYDAISQGEAYMVDPHDYTNDVYQSLDKEAILKALRLLTEKQREVVVLYFWYDLSQQEIADKLRVDKSSVRDRLASALNKLRGAGL